MLKESSVWRLLLLLLSEEEGLREGRWPSEKARRSWREEGDEEKEEENLECRNGVEELLSSILSLSFFLWAYS